MKMVVCPWPECAQELQEKLGLHAGSEREMQGGVLDAIIAAGFDVMVRHRPSKDGEPERPPTVHVSPGGRGFGQRG